MAQLRSKLINLIPALAVLFVAAFATPAFAQYLDSAIISASTLTADQKSKVSDYVKEHVPGLASGDPEKVKKSRNFLTHPLLENGVTVGFRSTFSELLVEQKLADLCKDKTELVAINALRVAGELTTPDARSMLTEGMSDKRASVRYAAVFACIRTFEQAAPSTRFPAMNADGMTPIIEALSKVLTTEKEANIVDASARALLAATKVEKPKFEIVRDTAMRELTSGLTTKLKAVTKEDHAILDAAQRAAASFRDELSARGQQISEGQRKMAVGLAGDILTAVSKLVQTGAVPQVARDDSKIDADKKKEERKSLAASVTTAENVVLFAVKAAGQTPGASALGKSFDEATKDGDARFVVQFGEMVNSVLVKPPFALEADRFKTK